MQQRIMAAAVEEMNERGIKFTMGDLARRLGVSKRCLYEYFASKEELIHAIVGVVLTDIQEQRKAVLADGQLNFEEKLRRVLTVRPKVFCLREERVSMEIKRLLPAEWERIERFMSRNWRTIEEFLRLGIQQGYFRYIYVPIVEKMIKGTFREVDNYCFLAQNNVSMYQVNEYMVDILLYGIVSPKQG
ncbi:MAG: TetR/AcrR family transcriptional regulator [Veillonellales bacterium]